MTTSLRRHLLAEPATERQNAVTRCGIMIHRRDETTWERRGWGGGPVVLISSDLKEVDCQRCLRYARIHEHDRS